MNDIFSQNEEDPFGNQIPKVVPKDRIADTGDYEEFPKKPTKKPSHATFNFKRRRTTMRQVVYDPFVDDNTIVTHFNTHRRSTNDEKETDTTGEKNHISKASDEEKDEDVHIIWSPLFSHMIWKFIFRWTVIPLFISLSKTSVLITLVVYPFLVIPGYF
jgi:hypothetical protein